jgi:hypothetical protein
MSANDNDNQFETLRDDESRSEEESSAGDSTADFFVGDDDVDPKGEDERTELTSQGLDNLAKVHPEDQGVPIFNTSNRELGVQEVAKGQGEGLGAGGDGRILPNLGRPPLSTTGRGMENREAMKMNDLDSYQGNSSVSTLPQSRKEGPVSGEITKVDRLSPMKPRENSGLLTQGPKIHESARAPLNRGGPQEGKASGQKPSTREVVQPQTLARHKEKGEVQGFSWESAAEDDWEEGSLDAGGRTWAEVDEELSTQAEVLERALSRVLEDMKKVSDRRNQHLREGEERGLAEAREALAEEINEGGSLVRFLLLDAEDKGALKMRPVDLAESFARDWTGTWAAVEDSKKTSFDMGEVQQVMLSVDEHLHDMWEDLTGALGPEVMDEFLNTHLILAVGLSGGRGISREVARVFPQDKAADIISWYHRLSHALTEISRSKYLEGQGLACLGDFMEKYPGPHALMLHRPGAYAQVSKRGMTTMSV